ncbi:MAG: peptidoglycan editing factor PgeF [Nitrospiraceae bacterium]|jgi:YfiH family protein|nr:peptidoglycan editing factor PgeF [Nitrospiraceae bacterium]
MLNYLVVPESFQHFPVAGFFTTKQADHDLAVLARHAGVAEHSVYLPIQKHTDTVQIVETVLPPVVADAVLTHRTGLMIGVQTADCVPILVCDPLRRVAGAIHAGWRGTAAGILLKTIGHCSDHYSCNPSDLYLAIGPSICGDCYEVGSEVAEGVQQMTGRGDYLFERQGKPHVDLRRANRQQALAAGIPADNIWISPECTFCLPDKYHSYRYAKGFAGRQYSFIALRD